MKTFSHIDNTGRAKMVDVSHKKDQLRKACAIGKIQLSKETMNMIMENQIKKGDVLRIAEFAGIQGAKKTSELIPLCHILLLSEIYVKADLCDNGVSVESRVSCIGKTGVEMEALTAVSTALLTVYDMCKAVDKNMEIGKIKLLEKTKEHKEE